MTQIELFHSVLGLREGVHDAAGRMRAEGHDVLVPDLFEGRVFDDYDTAIQFEQSLGTEQLMRRATLATADLPDGFVTAGFSMGGAPAVYLATQRPVIGVLMLASACQVKWFGPQARWPSGVPAQLHTMLGDPWREQSEIDGQVRDVEAAGGRVEVFDYDGDGHLFTDPSLPKEHDPIATELMFGRVLGFLRGLEV
jgi:dienelactone hydrolase